MKTVLITVVIIILNCCCAIAQDDFKNIRTDAEKYFEHLKKIEIEASFEYMYPEIFKMVPRETMLNTLKETYQDSIVKMSFTDFQIDGLLKPIEKESVLYAALFYRYTLTIHYAYEMDKEIIKYSLENLKMIHGEDNVKYDKKNRNITIFIQTRTLAIKASEYNNWKFIEYKYKGSREMLSQIINKEILDHFDIHIDEVLDSISK